MIFKALVRAHEDPNYTSVLENAFGIVFLVTPHRASKKWGSLGSVAASSLTALTLGLSTNDQLVKDLKNGSPKLEQIARSFLYRATKLKIVSFYELQRLGSMPWPVRFFLKLHISVL